MTAPCLLAALIPNLCLLTLPFSSSSLTTLCTHTKQAFPQSIPSKLHIKPTAYLPPIQPSQHACSSYPDRRLTGFGNVRSFFHLLATHLFTKPLVQQYDILCRRIRIQASFFSHRPQRGFRDIQGRVHVHGPQRRGIVPPALDQDIRQHHLHRAIRQCTRVPRYDVHRARYEIRSRSHHPRHPFRR
jgi:hypothetical protein